MVGPLRLLASAALACSLTLCLLPVGGAAAAPADLDRSFGGDGIVRIEGPLGRTFPSVGAARMAIGPEDEIFVLYSQAERCQAQFSCEVDLAMLRYDRDGNRDPSFGVGPGSQLTTPGNGHQHSFDLAVGPDGKPVALVGGRVVRFDHEGRLDATFGIGGEAFAYGGLNSESVVAVQGDGKILVAGEGERGPTGSVLHLTRFLPSGELDPSFGSNGEATMTLGTRSRPVGILPGPDGSISVATPQCCGGTVQFGNGFSLARFLADGRPDPGFDGDGQMLFQTPEAQAPVEAATLAPDGSLFVSFEEDRGYQATQGNVVKLSPSGVIDPTFGGGGRLWLYNRDADNPDDLVVDPQGRLVGVGGSGDISFFRLRPDGGRDRTFKGGQQVSFRIGRAREIAIEVGLQSDGQIVALGESDCCTPKLYGLIRLRGGTDRSRCLGRRATVVGTRKRDELTGTPRRDVVAALGGNDTVRALGGADLICGGTGKDQLFGGAGKDQAQQRPGGEPVVR